MNSAETNSDTQPENSRQEHQTEITQYIERDNQIKHEGYIDEIKLSENTRILSLNPNGINPWDDIQSNMLTDALQRYQIDIAMLNETNIKWTPRNMDKIENILKQKNREVKVIGSDSTMWSLTDNNYLPGGLLTIIQGKCRSILKDDQTNINKLGNWMATTFQHNNKTIAMINIYRLPTTSSQGPRCCLTQCNLKDGEIKSNNTYRKEILHQIKEYVSKNNVNDIIIGGDFNQSITTKEIEKFYNDISVKDIHSTINFIDMNELDNTNVNSRHPIDSIAASAGIMQYIEGCKLLNNNDILYSDHRSYIIDVNLEEYFNDQFSSWNDSQQVIINPSRKSHREKFTNIIEEKIDEYQLETMIDELQQNPIESRIEVVDNIITKIFSIARKKIEGINRRVPYSREKAQSRECIAIWRSVIRKINNKPINQQKLSSQAKKWNININDNITIEEAHEKLKEAKEKWEKVKANGREYREKYLLDYHPNTLDETNQHHKKIKRKAMKNIEKQIRRNQTFKYLTKHAGKGVKGNLKRLHIIEDNQTISRTIIGKENIEHEIKKFNENHFKQAHQSEMYKDKIYAELENNEIRDKILNGQLTREECDSKNVWEFLKLLKQPSGLTNLRQTRHQNITIEDWYAKVSQAKKNSASSIFSKRTYAIYKCALGSNRMSEILTSFYNIILRKGYFPNRWANIVDVMLEKGKGPRLGKLRTITLIEGDLQILMRIFLDAKNKELIENNERFSTANYGSRKNYSIETAILEKRLILDHSILSMAPTIYNFTDLKSCYDRQLAKVGGILEESTDRNRNAMKLFTKIMPVFKHYINTGYGISEEYYGGAQNELAGTGQGNKFSGDMCRDVSCLIIKQLENKELGIICKSPSSQTREQCVSVSFVDDTDFITDGNQYEDKMQDIVNKYHQLYTATGGQIEVNKTKYFAWKWRWRQGRKEIQHIKANITIDNQTIQQMQITDEIKTLGIYISPTLQWSRQFNYIKDKMIDAINKINHLPINTHNAYLYYNTYLIKKVYFGCGIMHLNKQQEQILQTISESTILRKLGLSEKFPREILYSRKSALGIGLLKPTTIIAILAMKLCIGHMRMNDRIATILTINEEQAEWEYGYNTNIHQINSEYKFNKLTWNDEIGEMLRSRKMKITDHQNMIAKVTTNKSIMEYAIKYVSQTNKSHNIISIINHVRIYKQMLLPFELVGMTGNKQTAEWKQYYKKSCIKWKINFPEITRPSEKSIKIWKGFIEWLTLQTIQTMYDFQDYATFQYKISSDMTKIKEHVNDQTFLCIKDENHRLESRYQRSNEDHTEDESFNNAIVEFKASGQAIVCDIIYSSRWPLINMHEINIPFNDQITQAIQANDLIAASDASCKNEEMTGHWIIASMDRSIKVENTIYHQTWGDNTIVGAEAITLLELLEVIHKKSKHIQHGSIQIGFDNRTIYKAIQSTGMKPTQYTQDGGAAITRMKQIIEEATITIKLILITHSKRRKVTFQQNPIEYLHSVCDQRASQMYSVISQRSQITNIKYYGKFSLEANGCTSTNSIKEAIRIADGKRHEEVYRRRKFPHSHDMIDGEARVCIPISRITPSLIKCVHGFNHYGTRSVAINDNEFDESCPRCSETENWEHVVRCVKTVEFRKDFITDMAKELLSVKQNEVSANEIFDMLEDILNFMEENDEDDYETNQNMVGMTSLFRGHVVKVWKGVNFNQTKYKALNKILSKHCILYYQRCWKDRNEYYHNEELQKNRAVEWKRAIEQHVETNEGVNIRNFMRQMQIDEQRSSATTILKWIYNMKNAMKKVKQMRTNDIRKYFEL